MDKLRHGSQGTGEWPKCSQLDYCEHLWVVSSSQAAWRNSTLRRNIGEDTAAELIPLNEVDNLGTMAGFCFSRPSLGSEAMHARPLARRRMFEIAAAAF